MSSEGGAGSPRVDRRVRRSRRAMVEAFDRLLATRPVDKITVSAIAQEADVDRKTFYQHFGSVEGLIDAIAEAFVASILDEVGASFDRSLIAEDRAAALRTFFRALVEHLSQGLERERGYFENMPADMLFERLLAPFERQIVERGLLAGYVPDEKIVSCLSFVLGGMLALFRWWLASGEPVPIEELADLANTLTESGLRGVHEV